jgi:hypothetical protein
VLSIKNVFNRKKRVKAEKGLPLKKLDEQAQWLIKQVEKDNARNKVARRRVHMRIYADNYLALGALFAATFMFAIALPAIVNTATALHYRYTPIGMISLFSSEQADLISNVRKSGCMEVFIPYALTDAYTSSRMATLADYKACANRSMERSS